MPISALRFPRYELVVSQFVGAIDDSAFIEYYRSFLGDEGIPPHWKELIDLRRVTSLAGISPAGFKAVADRVESTFASTDNNGMAAVVAPQDLAFGLARMYEMGSAPSEVPFSVHRTVDEALGSLGFGVEDAAQLARFLERPGDPLSEE